MSQEKPEFEQEEQMEPQMEEAQEATEMSEQEVLVAKVAELEAALMASQAKVKEQQDSVVRAAADVENMRRRATQDVEKAHKFALEKFAKELLPVIDNLERAVQSADAENEAVKPVLEGIELTQKSFISSVEKFGLVALDPQGEAFDPEKHQAMAMQPSNEVKPNHVMAVLQKGYELNGRVIRPAMVMVAKAADVDTTA